MVPLWYLAYTYDHLCNDVCHGVDIEVISYSPLLGLTVIVTIMQRLVLAFSALPLEFYSCICGLSILIEMIEIMMNLFSIWQHIYKSHSTSCQLAHQGSLNFVGDFT